MSPILLASLIAWIIQALIFIIIVDAILTWFPSIDRRNPIVQLLRRITEPMYQPIRRVIPPQKTGYIDLSPIIAILLLNLLGGLLQGIVLRLLR